MKFDSRKPVDILRWSAPVKLNRKDLRRPDNSVTGPEAPKAVGPMLGPDGKPVIGMDGRIVMVDAEGKPIHGDSTSGGAKNKNGAPVKRKFQKKTKQVFKVPEATRQLRKEERYPWVMEDATGTEVWVGKMEEVSKAETQAFFMPASNNTFKFVPAHRWYKFQKKPNYHIPNLEEAESLVCKYIFYVFPASTFAQDGHEAEEQGSRTMASTETWRERSLRSDLCLVEGGVTGEFCQRREFRSRR
jgi:transcription initiation factor TFIIF subunit alpha